MQGNKFIAVRLNSNSYPAIPNEENKLKKIGAKLIYIEGSTSEEIIEVAKDCDALLVVSSKIRANVIRKIK